MKTTIMSHFDAYNLIIMTDNDITPTELFTHFLNKVDTQRVNIEYEKDDDDSLTFKRITVTSGSGNYYDIDYDKFSLLNLGHFINISW
jgi:hypothetical protein